MIYNLQLQRFISDDRSQKVTCRAIQLYLDILVHFSRRRVSSAESSHKTCQQELALMSQPHDGHKITTKIIFRVPIHRH